MFQGDHLIYLIWHRHRFTCVSIETNFEYGILKMFGKLTNKQPRIFWQLKIHSYKKEKQRCCTLDPEWFRCSKGFRLQKTKRNMFFMYFIYTDKNWNHRRVCAVVGGGGGRSRTECWKNWILWSRSASHLILVRSGRVTSTEYEPWSFAVQVTVHYFLSTSIWSSEIYVHQMKISSSLSLDLSPL